MKSDSHQVISQAVINRLPRYYRYLRELLANNIRRISSSELSGMMGVTASQIRQDLNCFGGFGQQGYGYNVKYLFDKISEILGAREGYHAVIIGAGNLGSALAGASAFYNRGVILDALFDVNPAVIGKEINGKPVYGWDSFRTYLDAHKVDIAVLTVPKSEARPVCDALCSAGISGIWNFTGIEIRQKDVPVKNVHLGDILMTLCYDMRKKKDEDRDEPENGEV